MHHCVFKYEFKMSVMLQRTIVIQYTFTEIPSNINLHKLEVHAVKYKFVLPCEANCKTELITWSAGLKICWAFIPYIFGKWAPVCFIDNSLVSLYSTYKPSFSMVYKSMDFLALPYTQKSNAAGFTYTSSVDTWELISMTYLWRWWHE